MIQRLRAYLFCFLFAAPDLAAAHTPIQGINNFYNGLLHPVLVPSHLMLLIAAGLLFGQQELKETHVALMSFFPAVVLGLISSGFSPGSKVEIFILVCAACIGLLIAASPRIPVYWYSIIGVVAGFILGFDSAQETLSGKDKFIALFGSGVGIYFISLYPIGLAEYCNNKHWLRIGVRVLGSWIAASSLLVLALSIKSA